MQKTTTFSNIELLAPAGNMQKLKIALYYGADAVYVGGKNFTMRAQADNFTDAELKTATTLAHDHGKKIYVTVNTFARNNEFPAIKKFLHYLKTINVDAVITSDLGILRIARETGLPAHISTQANVLNKYTAEEYVRLGASRIILARECNLDEITEIATHLKNRAEIEVFVHGAICTSYSGRCLLSSYIVGAHRDANRGACTQPCRFKYALVEEKRPGEYMPIEEDSKGSYIMNSRDLCLIDHLDKLAAAGVTSFKIEGRVKSEHYVAGVVNAYRRKMNGENFDHHSELAKISHRPYDTGFLLGAPNQYHQSALPHSTHDFTAIVTEKGIEQRNSFCLQDELEILSPHDTFNKTFKVTKITTEKGESLPRAKTVQQLLKLECPYPLHPGDILRRRQS